MDLDSGWKPGSEIFLRDAERKLLAPLREHGWTAEVERVERQGEHVVITAERNGFRRRLIALANALDGMSREAAARAAGMDRQTLRDWVIRFNAEGVDGLRDAPRPGRPARMSDGQQAAVKALILRGPDPGYDGVSAWRVVDLC